MRSHTLGQSKGNLSTSAFDSGLGADTVAATAREVVLRPPNRSLDHDRDRVAEDSRAHQIYGARIRRPGGTDGRIGQIERSVETRLDRSSGSIKSSGRPGVLRRPRYVISASLARQPGSIQIGPNVGYHLVVQAIRPGARIPSRSMAASRAPSRAAIRS